MDERYAPKRIIKEKEISEIDLQWERVRKATGSVAYLQFKHLIVTTRADAIRQLDIVLGCAMQAGARSSEELAGKNMAAYEEHDLYAAFCNHNHHRYGDLMKILARCFTARITAMRELLSGQGKNYDELVRNRFATKKEALSVLRKELEERALSVYLVEENTDLLKLPFGIGAPKAIDSLQDHLGFSACRLSEELDRIYSAGCT